MHWLIDSFIDFFGTIDYTAIFILMTLESSIFPVPSELVMIPAGMNAQRGLIDPFFAILMGGFGSVAWALLNYFVIGKWLWKPFLEKFGKYILITEEKYKTSEDLFLKNSYLYTFIGRLLPVVRHLISIPAGIFRMPLVPFVVITFVGATLWCAILVVIGYFLGPLMMQALGQYGNWIGIGACIFIAMYLWYKIFYEPKRKKSSQSITESWKE